MDSKQVKTIIETINYFIICMRLKSNVRMTHISPLLSWPPACQGSTISTRTLRETLPLARLAPAAQEGVQRTVGLGEQPRR